MIIFGEIKNRALQEELKKKIEHIETLLKQIDTDFERIELKIIYNTDVSGYEQLKEIIVDAVCDYYNFDKTLFTERRRTTEFVNIRRHIMFLLYGFTGMALKQIAYFCGKHEHTTVIHNLTTHLHLMYSDKEYRCAALAIYKEVRGKLFWLQWNGRAQDKFASEGIHYDIFMSDENAKVN